MRRPNSMEGWMSEECLSPAFERYITSFQILESLRACISKPYVGFLDVFLIRTLNSFF